MRDKLASEVMTIGWAHLAPHAARDALWVVDGPDLVQVAVALAQDDVAAVKRWLEAGAIRRPDAAQVESWNARGTLFRALIVQPWVVAEVEQADTGSGAD